MASQGTLLWVQAGAPAAPRCLSQSPFPPIFFLHYFRNLSWLLRCPGYSECTLMLERTLLLGDLTPCHQHVQTLDSSGFAMTTFMKHSFEQYPIPIVCNLSCRFTWVWPTEPSMLFKGLREYRADHLLLYLSFN